MPVITAIEPQQHDPDRVNIDLDGRFGLGIALMLVMARGLAVGRELTDGEVESLRHDDSIEKAHAAALNFLSYRPRSRREVERRLARSSTEPAVVDAVVDRLEHTGLLDDGAFARFWVDSRQTFRPRGKMALRAEMRQKGLENEVIDEALERVGDEDKAAYEAGTAKLRSYRSLDDREFVRRMIGYLQRRGFAYGIAGSVARRLLTAREGSNPEVVADLDVDL